MMALWSSSSHFHQTFSPEETEDFTVGPCVENMVLVGNCDVGQFHFSKTVINGVSQENEKVKQKSFHVKIIPGNYIDRSARTLGIRIQSVYTSVFTTLQ